jgi:broad specificity phosphatase PhoE
MGDPITVARPLRNCTGFRTRKNFRVRCTGGIVNVSLGNFPGNDVNQKPRSARLTLICHGATAATRAPAFPLDEPLEDGVAAEAARLAGSLRHHDRAWTSPALCARQTADALSLEAEVQDVLRNCAYGRWAGLALADIARDEPDALSTWLTNPDATPRGGETVTALCRRVAEWLPEPMKLGGHTIAVTHSAVMRAAVLHILGAPATSFWHSDIEPHAMLDLRSDGKRWNLRVAPPFWP